MTLQRFIVCAAIGIALVLVFTFVSSQVQPHSAGLVAPHEFFVRPHLPLGGKQPVPFNWKPYAIGALGLALIFFTKNDKAQNAGGVLIGAAATTLLA